MFLEHVSVDFDESVLPGWPWTSRVVVAGRTYIPGIHRRSLSLFSTLYSLLLFSSLFSVLSCVFSFLSSLSVLGCDTRGSRRGRSRVIILMDVGRTHPLIHGLTHDSIHPSIDSSIHPSIDSSIHPDRAPSTAADRQFS